MRFVFCVAAAAALSAGANAQIVVAGPDYKPPVKIESAVCTATLGDHRTAYSTHIWIPNDSETRQRIAREFESYAKTLSRYARHGNCAYAASYNSIPTNEPSIVATGWTGGYPTEPPARSSARQVPRDERGNRDRSASAPARPAAPDAPQRVRRDNPLGKTPNQVKYELAQAVHQARLAKLDREKAALEAKKEQQRAAARQVLSQHDQALARHREVVAASEREQAQYRARLAAPARAPDEKVEFKEGVVLCQKRPAPSKEWRCPGPLQVTYANLDNLAKALVSLGEACGSSKSIRDLGMVSGYRAFGCGFGIHPTARDYPGNTDVPAQLGVGYVPGRGTFYCPRSKLAYCRG